jgi:hypothetical protein
LRSLSARIPKLVFRGLECLVKSFFNAVVCETGPDIRWGAFIQDNVDKGFGFVRDTLDVYERKVGPRRGLLPEELRDDERVEAAW